MANKKRKKPYIVRLMRKIKKTLAVVSAAVLTLTTGSTVVMAEKEGYTTFEFADTNAGEIRGYKYNDVYTFLGVPYAEAERYEEPQVKVKDENLVFRIIRASFNQRRKTLANGLKNSAELDYTKEEIEAAIEAPGRGASIRGEALTLEEFAKLADFLYDCR